MDIESLNRRRVASADVEALALRYRAWERWGPDDQVGAANHITQSVVRDAAQLIRRGAVFPLALPLDASGPQKSGTNRPNPQHVMLLLPSDGSPFPRQGFTDDAVYMPLQAATQWDGLCHAFLDGVSYNGQTAETIGTRHGAKRNSITNLTDRATGRGVLLDIARFKGRPWLEPGESIQAEDLERCAERQGVTVTEGDFVLIRTGQIAQARSMGDWGDYAGGAAPGLGVSAAEYLCPRGVTAVATDTWGVEVKPYETEDMMAPLHVIFLINAGIYLGEMWDLEALAEDCAEDGVYEFFLTAPPLTITGSVGSPVTPLAIK